MFRCNVCIAIDLYVQTYTVKVHDLSAEPKTADNHLSQVLSDIDYAEKEHKVRVIAWVSDAGGDSHAMRVWLNQMHPHLLVFDCWAHQVFTAAPNTNNFVS